MRESQGIIPCAPVPPRPINPLPSDGILGLRPALRLLRPGAAGGWGRPFARFGGGLRAIERYTGWVNR